jgi:hypothetical protein
MEAEDGFCWRCGSPKVLPEVFKTDPNLTLKDFANYTRPRPKRFVFYSIALGLIVLGLLIVGIYLIVEHTRREDLSGVSLNWVIVYLGAITLLWRLSRKFRINSQDIVLRDVRSPILYLRSFSEEANEEGEYRDEAKSDEILALAVREVGPLVAVGNPGERLQSLGAARLYFENKEWRENVEALMSLSRFVIIQAGFSSKLNESGLEWEMLTAMKRLKPEQLIYSFVSWQKLSRHSRQNQYEIFVMQYERIHGGGLPLLIGDSYFLYFDQNWRPSLASLTGWKGMLFWIVALPSVVWKILDYVVSRGQGSAFANYIYLPTPAIFRKASAASVREALRPILDIQGIKLPIWRTALYVSFVLGLMALTIVYVMSV